MSLEALTDGKEKIAARVAKIEAISTNMAIERVAEYLGDNSADQGIFCADAVAAKYNGITPLVPPTKYRQVLDAAHRLGYTDMFVPKGTGRVHYQYKSALAEDLLNEKKSIAAKVVEADKGFTNMAIDKVIKYFREMEENPQSPGNVCAEMIAAQYIGMPFVNQARINIVLDAMHREGYLRMDIPKGTGTPHYWLSKK